MSKGSDQIGQWFSSLRELAKYPDLIRVSRNLPALMAEEREKKAPCTSLVANESIAPVRTMLEEVENGTCKTVRDLIDGPLKLLLPPAMEAWSDSEKHKAWMLRCRDIFVEAIGQQRLKVMRRSPEQLRDWFASKHASGILFQGLQNVWGLDDATAVGLLAGPSVSVAFISAHIGLAVRWACGGWPGIVAS
jgi:hypothetical protein